MDEARDTVMLALPFTAGILSFSCLTPTLEHTCYAASMSLILLSFMLAALLLSQDRSTHARNAKIIITGYLTGIFVYSTAHLCRLTQTDGQVLVDAAARAGSAMQQSIDSIAFISDETNALIKALLTGNREGLSPETTNAFRSSGAAHILALSGLHLGIIYMIISKLTVLAGGHPKAAPVRSAVCIATCSAYSFATGAGASITRALIFIIINEVARLLHRKSDLKTTLASSLIIHLNLSPADISDIGFQLSYAAIAGIAWIFPWVRSFWPDEGDGIMKRIWESAALSISCQMATGPLAWIYFGTFPQYFILTNLIALPLTSLIIPAALLTLLLNTMGICPDLLIQGTEMLTNALCGALETIASI